MKALSCATLAGFGVGGRVSRSAGSRMTPVSSTAIATSSVGRRASGAEHSLRQTVRSATIAYASPHDKEQYPPRGAQRSCGLPRIRRCR